MKLFPQQFGRTRARFLATALLTVLAAGFDCEYSPLNAAASRLDQGLSAYDAAIKADATKAVATLTAPVTLDGKTGSPFNFGTTSGDATLEFILQGDPTVGDDGYLAVGETATSSLRYAQWQKTLQLGFTQSGVADYLFSPAVSSPTNATHIAYVWNSADASMSLYINGTLASTATSVSPDFVMPSGAGFLGATASNAEGMTGMIYRVSVYSGALADTEIKSHADAFTKGAYPQVVSFTATPSDIATGKSSVLAWQVQNATAVSLNGAAVTATNQTVSPAVTTTYILSASNEVTTITSKLKLLVDPRLDLYDAAIAADKTSGLTPLATLTNTVAFDGTAGAPFDFGATSGDATMEFILEGDPAAGNDGYLAVGENTSSNLRYAQWQNTQQMGFTQLGVADYLFVPGVPSPTIATHVAYVWNAAATMMKIYINGVASGTITNVSSDFAMPTGAGSLGGNPSNAEVMTGRIYRVVVYSSDLPDATIQKHATAFTSVLRPPIINSFTANPDQLVGAGSSVLKWQVQDATAVYLNGANVTGTTNQTVSPTLSTTYTLVASNSVSTVTAKVKVSVDPLLTKYDAAIAADKAGGLTPIVTLTNTVTLSGSGGVPFDFGTTSGDITMEFILEGDPTAGADGYLAVGENTTSNLRYAQWQNTHQMGFTQLGVADYLFTPAVSSPVAPTHLTYVWNSTDLSMTLYTNGVVAGTSTGVTSDFAMPTGAGFLGSTPGGGEAMVGRIFRIVTYAGDLPVATIQKHASAFSSASGGSSGPSLAIVVKGAQPNITLQGVAGTHYRVEYRDSLSTNATWQLLQDIPSLSLTTITVTDTTATTGRSERFYRAVVP